MIDPKLGFITFNIASFTTTVLRRVFWSCEFKYCLSSIKSDSYRQCSLKNAFVWHSSMIVLRLWFKLLG